MGACTKSTRRLLCGGGAQINAPLPPNIKGDAYASSRGVEPPPPLPYIRVAPARGGSEGAQIVLPWRPGVLRSCDMDHVMLHLIFSLPHAWGGKTCSGTLPQLLDSGGFSVGSLSAPDNDSFGTRVRSEIAALSQHDVLELFEGVF